MIPVLPLVDDLDRDWKSGWCTYTDGFENNPDVEFISGGENDKTPSAAAIWRQGNLLHFGFEQSPEEMNTTGQQLLLNCLVYISRFAEDRPIAVTPSVFAGPVALPRGYPDRRFGGKGDVEEGKRFLSTSTVATLRGMTEQEVRDWYVEHRKFIHPDGELKLEVDADARDLDVPIDTVELFEKTIPLLAGEGANSEKAARLLERYGPFGGPTGTNPDDWWVWFRENRLYIFFSDQGDYKWYVDPLAKKRGVPTDELRGPHRATTP